MRLALVLALLAAPVMAQEPAADPFPIAAAGWCSLTDGESDPPADPGPDAEVTDEEPAGCDLGVAAALYRFKRLPRLSVVGALGTGTLGAGLGWTFHRTPAGTAYGVALGAVAPWGPEGIDLSDWSLALGATLSFTRAGRGDP